MKRGKRLFQGFLNWPKDGTDKTEKTDARRSIIFASASLPGASGRNTKVFGEDAEHGTRALPISVAPEEVFLKTAPMFCLNNEDWREGRTDFFNHKDQKDHREF